MSTRCEEVVSTLAAGGPLRRWMARRHAARCPRCAEARDELRRVAEALADAPSLTAAQRRLWVAVAGSEVEASPSRVWRPRPALAAMGLAAAVLVAVVLRWVTGPADRRPGPPAVVDHGPPASGGGVLRDVEGVRDGVVALSRELDDLRRRADLLEARKEADALLTRLAPRGGSTGL